MAAMSHEVEATPIRLRAFALELERLANRLWDYANDEEAADAEQIAVGLRKEATRAA